MRTANKVRLSLAGLFCFALLVFSSFFHDGASKTTSTAERSIDVSESAPILLDETRTFDSVSERSNDFHEEEQSTPPQSDRNMQMNLSLLPRCLLPAMLVPRPHAAVSWMRRNARDSNVKQRSAASMQVVPQMDHIWLSTSKDDSFGRRVKKRREHFESHIDTRKGVQASLLRSQLGDPDFRVRERGVVFGSPRLPSPLAVAEKHAPATYFASPTSFTFFRPPLSKDVIEGTSRGSDAFFHYDEKVWGLFRENVKMYGVVVPDRVVYLFFQDQGEWETEFFVKHISPPFYRRSQKMGEEVVFTFHFVFDSSLESPDSTATKFVETIECLREHLGLWYNKTVLDDVFFDFAPNSHRTNAAMVVSDLVTPIEQLMSLLGLMKNLSSGTMSVDFLHIENVSASDEDGMASIGGVVLSEKASRPWLPPLRTLISASDEYGSRSNEARSLLKWSSESEDRIYLRQYSPLKLTRSENSNPLTKTDAKRIAQIILGARHHKRGLLTESRILNTSQFNRPFLWSFLGSIKSDRHDMLKHFGSLSRKLDDNEQFQRHKTPTEYVCCDGEDVEAIYSRTLFVPIGRGFISLDCFRIYEACASGAIPIVVGNIGELIATFSRLSVRFQRTLDRVDRAVYSHGFAKHDAAREALLDLPPFVFASSWERAAEVIEHLVLDERFPEAVASRQLQIAKWFVVEVNALQNWIVYGRLWKDTNFVSTEQDKLRT